MGVKFYRGADKPKKIRKRIMQTRSWFRTFKWVAYHAHPLMIPGHPFKGGVWLSTGQLLHPDLKRFGLATAVFFKPPMPFKNPYDGSAPTNVVPSFSDFFGSYFGATWNKSNLSCTKIYDNMAKCYSNHMSKNPTATCEHYINSFKRLSCAA